MKEVPPSCFKSELCRIVQHCIAIFFLSVPCIDINVVTVLIRHRDVEAQISDNCLQDLFPVVLAVLNKITGTGAVLA